MRAGIDLLTTILSRVLSYTTGMENRTSSNTNSSKHPRPWLKQTNIIHVQLQKFHPVTWTRCATQSSHYTEETLCAFSSYALIRRAAATAAIAVVPRAAAAALEAAIRPPRRRCRRIQSQAHPLPFSASVVLVLKSERCLHFYTYMYAQTYPAGWGRIGSTSALTAPHSLPCRAAAMPPYSRRRQSSSLVVPTTQSWRAVDLNLRPSAEVNSFCLPVASLLCRT